jgi:hypothetical protein
LIILGVILLIIGFITKIAIVWTIGVIAVCGRHHLGVARDGRSRGRRTQALLLAAGPDPDFPLGQEGGALVSVGLGTRERDGPVAVALRREAGLAGAVDAPAAPAAGGVLVLCWRLTRVSWPRAAMRVRKRESWVGEDHKPATAG